MDKSTANALTLLRDDLLKAFKDKRAKTQHDNESEDLKPEKTADHLSRFKNDLSSVFRFGLSVDKEKKKDSKIKAVTDEGNSTCLRKEEQPDCGFRETLSQQNKDNNTGDGLNHPELNKLDPGASEQKSETQEAPRRQTARFDDANHAVELETQEDEFSLHQEEHKDMRMKETGAWLIVDQHREHPSPHAEKEPSISVSPSKDDVSGFRSKLSKEKDKDDSSKLKVLKTKRSDGPLKNLFERDRQPCTCVADREEVTAACSEGKEEQLDCGARETVSQQNNKQTKRSNNNRISSNEAENPDLNRSQARLCEAQSRDKASDTSHSARTPGLFKNLFRRDPTPGKTPNEEASQRVQNRPSGEKEERPHCGSQQSEDDDRGDGRDANASQQKPEAGFSKTPETEVMSRGEPAVEQPSHDDHHRESEIPDARHQDNQDQLPLKTNHGLKQPISSLTLLKEDFHHFRDDLLNVFRIGLLKEKDNKEDASKVLSTEKNKELRNERLASGHRMNVAAQDRETFTTTDGSDLGQEATSEGGFTAAEGAEGQKVNTARDARPLQTLRWEASGLSLFSPRRRIDTVRGQLGDDLWSPKNFATYLTFDPNTANSELRLSDGNRKATRVWSDHRPSDHPERFLHCPQVLCREGLLDSVYWEVEWSGGADIGIAYNSISRDGDAKRCLLGHDERSWSLECSEGSYTPSYNSRRLRAFSPEPFSRRVGVHLDWSAGSLSFYCISQDATVHLHTFTSTFTEPLYAAFWIWAYGGSVSLCQVQQEWERLQ